PQRRREARGAPCFASASVGPRGGLVRAGVIAAGARRSTVHAIGPARPVLLVRRRDLLGPRAEHLLRTEEVVHRRLGVGVVGRLEEAGELALDAALAE